MDALKIDFQRRSHDLPVPPLAILTSLVGLGAVTAALISFYDPASAPQIYGLPHERHRHHQQQTTTPGDDKTNANATVNHDDQQNQQVLTGSLEARGFVSYLSLFVLSAHWWSTEQTKSKEASQAAWTCMTISGAIGTILPFVFDRFFTTTTTPPATQKGVAVVSKQHQKEQLRSLSVKNLLTGITVLSLTAYWQKAVKELGASSDGARTARLCLAMVLLMGTRVPFKDAFGSALALRRRSSSPSSSSSSSSTTTSGTKGLERYAPVVHGLRLLVWIAAGIWCWKGW